MRRLLNYLAGFIVILSILTGCQVKYENPDNPERHNQWYDRSHIGIVVLEDGTICAVAMYPGGLSCDFANRRANTP